MSKPNEVSVSATVCGLLSDVLLQSLNGIPANFNLSTFTQQLCIYTKCMLQFILDRQSKLKKNPDGWSKFSVDIWITANIRLSENLFWLISGLEKLSWDRTVSNSAKKSCSKLLKLSHNCLTVKLLPTHKQKHYFVVSAPGFS